MSTATLDFATALEFGEFVTGSACQDCTAILANGEAENPSDAFDPAEFEQTCADYDTTLGHVHFNEYDERCWHKGLSCEDDCDCERQEFSSKVCDMCGNQDHGYRHDITMVRRDFLSAKMTVLQYRKLRDLCHRYKVLFDPADYVPTFDLPSDWVAGWVGGNTKAGKTIYVGVSPEGDSHS